MVAPGYGYGIVAMAALGYGGPQSLRMTCMYVCARTDTLDSLCKCHRPS